MILVLMRHLNTEFCGSDRYCGRIDCELKEDAQFVIDDKLIRLLRTEKFEVFSSPMTRCVRTADKLKLILPIKSITQCEALLERNYGVYNGAKKQDVQALIDLGQEVDFKKDPSQRPCNGESRDDVRIRVHNFMDLLDKKCKKVLVITHQGVLREIYSWLGISDFIKFYPGEIRVEEI